MMKAVLLWLDEQLYAVQKWAAAKGGWAHVWALAYAAAIGAYVGVPAFHALVQQLHAAMPGWVQSLLTAALGLYAWYKTQNPPPA